MDVSPQYVKMCDQAVEIQEQAPTKCSDFPVTNCLRIFTDICGEWWADRINKPSWWYERKGEIVCYDPLYVWLPRQDELQEMILPQYGNTRKMLLSFADYVEYETTNKQVSMEQLWLSFCYKILYNKVWDNEKENWINNTAKDSG